MTLQEAKDQVAVEMGYKSFEHLYREFRGLRAPYSEIITAMDEAAELYAKSKWDEACESYKRELMNYLPYRDGESKTEPMNQLEKEIYDSLVSHENITERQNPFSALICKSHSKVAAAIALKWISSTKENP